MTSLWFVVPCHGREQLAAICLRQLRRTCDALTANGIEASAVVVAQDDNIYTARNLGFAIVERDNQFVSRKFNDGIQLACDPAYNPRPADYVVPCGSDDWVDYRIFLEPPAPHTVLGFQLAAFVKEDGRELSEVRVDYRGGVGIRMYHRETMAVLDYRPADEDRNAGCDTSILVNLTRAYGTLGRELRVFHYDRHPLQIVDWKSPAEQITGYERVIERHRGGRVSDPFVTLADVYPEEAIDEMRAHYARALVPA